MTNLQKIWVKHSLLGAFGGVILSALQLYALFTGRSILTGQEIAILLAVFWLISGLFIFTIVSGLSLRFRDGSLTLPQMGWAVFSTLLFMALSTIPTEPYYLLLTLVMTFGVFQLTPRRFIRFAVFASIVLGIQKLAPVYFSQEVIDIPDLIFNWCAYTFGLIILTSMCQSVSVLRVRLKERNKSLEEALQAKNLFLANMSHELRTPISGVVGMLHLLERTPLDEKQQHYVQLVHSSSMSLLSVVNDILDFSKIDAGKLDIENVEFDLMNLINDIAETTGHSAQLKKVEFVLDAVDVSHRTVLGDPVRVLQVINNLTSNALKFTKQGEIVITASTKKLDGKALQFSCSVRDTGLGIPEAKKQLIFESFSQADVSTTREFGGTGLGLSIVKKLCQLMNGDIRVSSTEGEGSCFSFDLLLECADRENSEEEIALDLSGMSYLVVDDCGSSGEVIQRQLEYWGAEVSIADSGYNALDIIRRRQENKERPPFSGLFIDCIMPDMGGVEFCRVVRHSLNMTDMALVLMHSIGSDLDDAELHEIKPRYVLTKPIISQNLSEALTQPQPEYLAPIEDAEGGMTKASEDDEKQTGLERSEKSIGNSLKTPEKTSQSESDAAELNGPLVLVVEDNEINQIVESGLFSMLGLRCDIANNGRDAIEQLQKSSPESAYVLVFMDCQMPEMDGFEATQRIRDGAAGSFYRNVPIIAMTANAMEGDRDNCLKAGMDDYLSKPFDVKIVTEKVANWLKKIAVEYQKPDNIAEATSQISFLEQDSSIWDLTSALHRINGVDDQLTNLIRLYLTSTPELLGKMEIAKGEGDYNKIQKKAHELKGVAGNIGAKRLMVALARLENACREKEFSKVVIHCKEVHIQHCSLAKVLNDYIS